MRAPHFSRARSLGAVLALVVLGSLTGCRTTAEVRIELDETGAGQVAVQVELDDAAAQRIGDLGELVAVADLEAAGWTVSTAERRVLAEKEVHSAEDLDRALEELTGPGGPFSGLAFGQRRTFARTTVEVTGSVDLSQGMAAFGDEELQRITGSVTGVDLPPEVLALTLAVDLPGTETSNATGPGTRWELPLGAVTPIQAESTDVNALGLTAVGVAVICALVLIAAGARRLRP